LGVRRTIGNLYLSFLFKGSNPGGTGINAVVDVFDGGFDCDFAELSIPRSQTQTQAVALSEHAEDRLGYLSAVV